MEQGPCLGTYCSHPLPGLVRLDIRDAAAVEALFQELRPEVCYLPAALTFMDYAEDHPAECYAINVEGPAHIARALRRYGGQLVFFSTEHVFGDSYLPRCEDEPTEPRSIYARSKAHAEQVIRSMLTGRCLILRASWVYGPDPQRKNFFCRVQETLKQGKVVAAPADQHGQPTYGPDLARTAIDLVRREAQGIYHVVGPRYLSRLSWARLIAKRYGFSPAQCRGQRTEMLRAVAPRPLRVCLDRRKLLAFLGCDPIRSPGEGARELTEMRSWRRTA
jgi:dTDP-4-dehydrorhamnose reductase